MKERADFFACISWEFSGHDSTYTVILDRELEERERDMDAEEP
jgi:hypothetical protein